LESLNPVPASNRPLCQRLAGFTSPDEQTMYLNKGNDVKSELLTVTRNRIGLKPSESSGAISDRIPLDKRARPFRDYGAPQFSPMLSIPSAIAILGRGHPKQRPAHAANDVNKRKIRVSV
jgi:hypothetical protein